jgi:hypothetical protein
VTMCRRTPSQSVSRSDPTSGAMVKSLWASVPA